jgi:hypothetical protein
MKCTTTSFLGTLRAGEIDQNPPHQLSRYSKKVRPILPIHLSAVNQLQIDLVDQRSCLQDVARSLSRHVVSRDSMQSLIN